MTVELAEVPSLRAVVQPDGQRDRRVLESVGGAGLRQQSATEHTPLPDEGGGRCPVWTAVCPGSFSLPLSPESPALCPSPSQLSSPVCPVGQSPPQQTTA